MMNNDEFCTWLEGFLSRSEESLTGDEVKQIKAKLSTVKSFGAHGTPYWLWPPTISYLPPQPTYPPLWTSPGTGINTL